MYIGMNGNTVFYHIYNKDFLVIRLEIHGLWGEELRVSGEFKVESH